MVGGAAGLIPAIALAFYSFLSQEPDVAEQRVGYVVLALLFLSPYVLALIASRVREPGVRGGLLLGVGLLSLVASFSTLSSLFFVFLPATFVIWFAAIRSLTVARRPLATVEPATVAGMLIVAIVGFGFFSLLWMQNQDSEVRCWVLTRGPDGHSSWESRPNVVVQGSVSVGAIGGERSKCISGVITNSGRDGWGPELCARRTDVTSETCEAYLHNLYCIQPDFAYSVSRDFARSCQTPMLVMPDGTPSHSYEAAMDLVELAPKAQVTAYPWKESPDVLAKTINQVRDFLLAHQPARTSR